MVVVRYDREIGMKKTLIIAAVLLMGACQYNSTEPAYETDSDGEGVRVQYIVLGDAYSVSLAFCSDLGPRDSVSCALLPLCYTMELPRGETAFMRVHCASEDVVTVGILIDGWFRAVDTAGAGEDRTEVYWTL